VQRCTRSGVALALLVLDESERGEFLAVGGLIVPTGLACGLEAGWRQLKAKYGLSAELPLKWAPPRESVERLRAWGLNVDDIRRSVCQWLVRRSDILALAMVHEERRRGLLRPGRGGVRDFYATGVAFAVQRFAKVVADPKFADRPHVVVLDSIAWSRGRRSPLWDNKITRFFAGSMWGSKEQSIVPWMAKGHTALLESYGDWHRRGISGFKIPPLEQSGFVSSFLEAHGDRMDMLQIADCVCGCAAELFFSVASGRPSPVATECMRTLLPVFCQATGFGTGVWGCGIVLYPPNNELWWRVRRLLEGEG
jgi:hypothetical protein